MVGGIRLLCSRNLINWSPPCLCSSDAGTPTTTAAVHRFDELTQADTSMQRLARKPFRRDTARVKQWILDQQVLQRTSGKSRQDSLLDFPDSPEPPAPSSGCNAYLAYSHLNAPPSLPPKANRTEDSSAECFVVVEEPDDMPRPGRDAFGSHRVRFSYT